MIKQVGIDIVQNKRIKLKAGFLAKVLSPEEQALYATLTPKKRQQEFVAGRWAVKEAIIKASQTTLLMHQIVVAYDENGAPVIKTSSLTNILISISHEHDYSVGFALNQSK